MSDAATTHFAQRGVVRFAGFQSLPALARFSLRGELSMLSSALQPSGIPVSRVTCRTVEGARCTALWLGPDEQLLLAPEAKAAALVEALQASLASVAHSWVDISDRQISFHVVGPTARALLNTGCPLDLSDAAFPIGMCTRTLFEKSEIVLWRTAEHTFHVEVWRSFAPYVTAVLAQAASELGG
jgi:sarcosine oxidase subunit gamma